MRSIFNCFFHNLLCRIIVLRRSKHRKRLHFGLSLFQAQILLLKELNIPGIDAGETK